MCDKQVFSDRNQDGFCRIGIFFEAEGLQSSETDIRDRP
ncbi:hypothetical protein EBBID32_42960 [Sphingobium indicum BiD32]|uniref:Uncharacterized protein n=1 Tax=Sphingobium indicum BiD32 TaxID=1301087 RepID=N1MRT1_9SPHN|nr:hypothetical protein EBBID32_42960 [Sphingobium indicum BiD32]